MVVRRFDLARLAPKTKITPQGFLEAPASFTRAGVFLYRRADGTTIRELRPESEVFASASLATLANAPVAVDHPGMITPANARQHAVGWVSSSAERKDSHVAGSLLIMDAGAIAKVQTRELCETSAGYQCRIDNTSGTDPKYGPYDQIQRDIRYNHVALGPKGWGRAGPDVGIRLDAGDAVLDTPLTNDPESAHTDPVSKQDHGDPIVKIKINGVTFDVEPAVAEAYAEESKRFDAARSDLDKLQGRFDAQAEKLQKTEAALTEAKDSERFDSAVKDRVDLIAKARKVLGDEAEIAGSAREIMEQALRQDKAEVSFEGKSDDYVTSRFDALIEDLPARTERKAKESKRAVRQDTVVDGKDKPEVDRYDADAARKRMTESHNTAWQKPLAVSRDQ